MKVEFVSDRIFPGQDSVVYEIHGLKNGVLQDFVVLEPGFSISQDPIWFRTADGTGLYSGRISVPETLPVGEHPVRFKLFLKKGGVVQPFAVLACDPFPRGSGRIVSLEGRQRLDDASGTVPISGNRVRLLNDNAESLALRLEMIRRAEKRIDIMTSDFQEDSSGASVAEALEEALDRGVEVNLILCRYLSEIHSDRIFHRLRTRGARVLLYGQSGMPRYMDESEFKPGKFIRDQDDRYLIASTLPEDSYFEFYRKPEREGRVFVLDQSIHGKALIVDGSRAVSGGRNLTDESFTSWVDQDLAIEGPAVTVLQKRFNDFLREAGIAPEEPAAAQEPVGKTEIRITVSKPWLGDYKNLDLLVAALDLAEETVWIDSQYIVLHGKLEEALVRTARRGVDVRILTNSWDTGKEVHLGIGMIVTKLAYRPLLKAGIRIYEWQDPEEGRTTHKPYRHIKRFLIDEAWMWTGSYNLSARSAYIESELMFALTDPVILAEESRGFQKDLTTNSREISYEDYQEMINWHRATLAMSRKYSLYF